MLNNERYANIFAEFKTVFIKKQQKMPAFPNLSGIEVEFLILVRY